jgi:energy-coupling factor transport system substrate-specific component
VVAVSWPLASFTIIAGALTLGWLAYERARPSARMIAIVATLAALAALGRDAFVALPDVKPITAMTLVVGYALGPLAGFTVGAVGMLASNILLGQGPYTPWQMVAWGLVGVFGAIFGRLTRRRASRLSLALACAASALAAKELMNVYTWTIGGAYTGPALLARVLEGLPYDVTDTVASFLFGFAFAPELARLLARTRARMEVTWTAAPARAPTSDAQGSARNLAQGGAALLALALLTGAALALAGARGVPGASAVAGFGREVAYLGGAQDADGGFGEATGRPSSELYSAWAAMGLAAAGHDPLSIKRGGHSLLDALRSEASTLEGAGDYERTILALRACGVPTRSLGSVDLEAKLLAAHRADGSFAGQVNLTAFAIFALRALGRSGSDPLARAAGRWLERQQDRDGGFGFTTRGATSEVDDTAAALQAILASGLHPRAVVARALSYITGTQNADGGFPEGPGGESNAQSTSWAVQGLVAAGRNVERIRRGGSRSPLGYLESLEAPDGSIRYSRTSAQTPVWVTAQALIALARKPFPVAPVRSHRSAGRSAASATSPGARTAPARDSRAGAASAGAPPSGSPVSTLVRRVGRSEVVALTGVVSGVASSVATIARRALQPIGVSSWRAARSG